MQLFRIQKYTISCHYTRNCWFIFIYPEKPVAIVESEKYAIIASCIFPELIWLSAGNLNGLSVEKCEVLTGRDVMLYPDLGAFEKWSLKATEIKIQCNCKVKISTLLENEATDSDRVNGLYIADYIIVELKSPLSSDSQKVDFLSSLGESPRRGIEVRGAGGEVFPEIQSFFSPTLQIMIEENPALLVLVNGLQLEEVS